MRRIVLALCMTAMSLVLLFGYRTSLPGRGTPAAALASTVAAGSAAPDAGRAATYDGTVVQTHWGPVQVQITVMAGRVTAATALQVPDGNRRDVEINDSAVPRLNAEAVRAQSAGIDTVSGATVTSEGYISSLQAALDEAGL